MERYETKRKKQRRVYKEKMRGSIKELGLGKRGENLQKEKCGIDTMVIEKWLERSI